jgi:hypothetical protein
MQPLSYQPRRSPLDDNRWIAGLVVAYAAVVLACLSNLPLWLDKILQIIGTRGTSFAQILEWLPGSAGAVPLPYFIQALALDFLGYSVFSARFPAALFSILGCAAPAWRARELRLQWAAVAVVLPMALPLQWRYALKSRPYSRTMFFTILTTILALRLTRAGPERSPETRGTFPAPQVIPGAPPRVSGRRRVCENSAREAASSAQFCSRLS